MSRSEHDGLARESLLTVLSDLRVESLCECASLVRVNMSGVDYYVSVLLGSQSQKLDVLLLALSY